MTRFGGFDPWTRENRVQRRQRQRGPEDPALLGGFHAAHAGATVLYELHVGSLTRHVRM